MPITPIQEKKKQKYLLAVLGLLVVVTIFVIWQGFLKEEAELSPVIPSVVPSFNKVEINWGLLEDPKLQGLKAFETISPYQGETGRSNPFLPY